LRYLQERMRISISAGSAVRKGICGIVAALAGLTRLRNEKERADTRQRLMNEWDYEPPLFAYPFRSGPERLQQFHFRRRFRTVKSEVLAHSVVRLQMHTFVETFSWIHA
jgi:hypothetical protein